MDVYSAQWSDYDDFKKKFGTENFEKHRSYWVLIAFYEGLGVLVKKNLIDISFIALSMAGATRKLWEKLAPVIERERMITNYPRLMSETEYLYNRLMKYIEKHPEIKT